MCVEHTLSNAIRFHCRIRLGRIAAAAHIRQSAEIAGNEQFEGTQNQAYVHRLSNCNSANGNQSIVGKQCDTM